MKILGISAFYHDSACSLIIDGRVVTALEEERFTRVKHDNAFPFNAIEKCLHVNGLSIGDIDYVAYYEKPLLKFERILQTFIETWPFSLTPFVKAISEWLGEKIRVGNIIKNKVGFKGKVFYIPHHLSHAGATFLTSPYKKAAILTIDGVGDVPTTGMWLGEGSDIKNIGQIDFPHSLGLFYSTWTAYLGFRVNSDEYKLMGLAAYGKPIYKDKVLKLLKVYEDGSFELDLKYFSFRESFKMWSKSFEKLFGNPRVAKEKITSRHKDLAASFQSVTEDIYFRVLQNLYKKTGVKNLCISGGVALNSLANGKIYKNTKFTSIYDFGPAGDSGASVGAALFLYNSLLRKPRMDRLKTLYLGTSYSDSAIHEVLSQRGLKFKKYADEKELLNVVAKLLSKNKIVGLFTGKMEFGPRALGHRSILANPKIRKMKDKVNLIKLRENFRPFAASVLQDKVHTVFAVPEKNHYSPFMNFCFEVYKDKRNMIASIVHKDNTCRIQTVNEDNGFYYKLIKSFYKLTGIPCVLNTSFNLSFEPIVESPKQAIDDFVNTKMDALVIGNYLVQK